MSDAVTALNGAEFVGTCTVRDAGLAGMITIRANLNDDAVRTALDGAGVQTPEARRISETDSLTVLWMSPDELLVLCPYIEAGKTVNDITKALAGHHSLVVDVSDARALMLLSGETAVLRETLAKLSPADLRSATLGLGEVRRSRLAQVPAAFWLSAEDEAHVICFRSVADYVFGLLKQSAEEGSEVGYF